MIKIYNTMTRTKEEFKPIVPQKVTMYVCGPTVYNYIHLGNARAQIAFDVIRRFLEYRGYQVNFVSNFTDVDDKIINASHELKVSAHEVADKFIQAFLADTASLNVKRATIAPKATENIPDIIAFIADLVEHGWAYEASGDVYFRAHQFPDYGKLAHKTIADLESGASGHVGEEAKLKEDPIDFALWKKAKTGEPAWESPWGFGRPGWHIECSVMAIKFLGETIDLHGGGQDLEFPHHTNEIAQSEAKTGKKFANYWLHNGFVTVGEDHEKMSKSLGNFVTVHELIKTVDPQVVRFLMATQHYRHPINFSEASLKDAEINLTKLKNADHNLEFRLNSAMVELAHDADDLAQLANFKANFIKAMEDDFNAANAMTEIYELSKWTNIYVEQSQASQVVIRQALAIFEELLGVLGIEIKRKAKNDLSQEVEALIKERNEARSNRNFARADEIRDLLQAKGVVLEDTAQGTRWKME